MTINRTPQSVTEWGVRLTDGKTVFGPYRSRTAATESQYQVSIASLLDPKYQDSEIVERSILQFVSTWDSVEPAVVEEDLVIEVDTQIDVDHAWAESIGRAV